MHSRRWWRLCAMAGVVAAAVAAPAASDAGGPSQTWRRTLDERVDAGAVFTVKGAFGRRAQTGALTVRPEIDVQLPWDFDLTVIGRFRGDAFDRLEPGRPGQPEVAGPTRRLLIGNHGEAELREFYVSGPVGEGWVTAGKQQIVWGKADGLKVLDVVTPQDFREFILDDFDESRIPLWSVKAEYRFGEWDAELVWIPDKTYHDLAEPDAAFAFTSPKLVPRPPPGVPVILRSPRRPGRFFADSDVGARVATFWRGWDLTFNYLYHYYDVPVFTRTIAPLGVVLEPEYDRTHLVGGTFSNAFGDWTVRGEYGYSFGRAFSVADLTDRDGLAETDEVSYVLGLDYFGLADTIVSVQFFQSILTDTPRGVIRDAADSTATALVRRDFRNDVLHAEVLWLQDLNHGDGLVRPKVTYDLDDRTTLWIGADVFYGTPQGFFGQFTEQDRVVVGLEWAI